MNMRAVLTVLLLLSTAAAGSAQDPAAGRTPEVIWLGDDAPQRTRWISLQQILHPDAASATYELPTSARRIVESMVETAGTDVGRDCRSGFAQAESWQGLPASLTEAVTRASSYVIVRVIDRDVGIWRELVPATLLTVEVVDGLTSEDARWIGQRRFLFVPSGRTKIDGGELCWRHPEYPDVPDVGEEVLFLGSIYDVEMEPLRGFGLFLLGEGTGRVEGSEVAESAEDEKRGPK